MDEFNKALGKSGQLVETNAANSPVKDIQWQGQEITTPSVPIIDPGAGKGVVLRSFFFKAAPIPKGFPKPKRTEIIAHYKKMIEMFLWKDGLTPLEHKEAQLYTRAELKRGMMRAKMKEEGADFVIMVLASQRQGQSLIDTPRILK